jgi:hypothetical protein
LFPIVKHCLPLSSLSSLPGAGQYTGRKHPVLYPQFPLNEHI